MSGAQTEQVPQVRIKGNLGALRVGYQRAVTFRNWNLTCSKETLDGWSGSLVGRAVKVDPVWSRVPPDQLGVYMGDSVWWVWRRLRLALDSIHEGSTIEIDVWGTPDIVPRF